MLTSLNLMFSLFSKIFLNPIMFIFFLFLMPKSGFIYANVNDSFINYKKFIPFAVIFFLLWSVIIFGIFSAVKAEGFSLKVLYQSIGQWR